jgi:L-fuculose-phosphate aldolase
MTTTPEAQARLDITTVCRRMYEKGFLAATDGNVSVRIGDRLIVTPSGVSKGHLAPEALIVTDMSGHVIEGDGLPSSEMAMHLAAYRARPDVTAVVHGHPPRAIAFTAAGVPLPGRLLPEVVVALGGEIPTVPYTTPTTDEVPRALFPYFERHDAVMMEWHGAVCLGHDVFEAYYKMEKVEHLCEVALYAQQLGGWRDLTDAQIQPLLAIRERMHAKATPAGC